MNKIVGTIGVIGTIAILGGIGYQQYKQFEQKSNPPQITVNNLQQNPKAYQQQLSPADLVKYVDTATSDLTAKSDPVSEVDALQKTGYLTSGCADEYKQSNGWTPANVAKYHFSGAKIDKLSVLHSAQATNDPNIWVVETVETDEYDFSNGKKRSYVKQTDNWFLLKNNTGQWQINSFEIVSSVAFKSRGISL